MKILSFSYCFPSQARPSWGLFVYQRLAALNNIADLQAVAPVPAFPLLSRLRNSPGPLREQWQDLTVHRPRFFYFPGILKSCDAKFYAHGLTPWLEQLIREWRPDLLDAHFIWPDGVGVSQLARRFNLPYTITLRGKIYPCLDIPAQKRQCADALCRAAAVISVSGLMAHEAETLGAPADRITVIPNGVDTSLFCRRDKLLCRKELGLPADGRLIVTVAHLGPRKGHRETIDALRQLPPDVRLVLVGGDPEAGKNVRHYHEMAARFGLAGRLIIPGPQPYGRVPLYFNAADVSVLASYREGCPNVVLESLASGTPVVASRVGAVPDLLSEPDNGRIIPARDADALAEALKTVLAADWSPDRLSRSPSVKTWDDVAREVHRVLEKIVVS